MTTTPPKPSRISLSAGTPGEGTGEGCAPVAPAVYASGLSKWIDDRPILQDVHLDIPQGSFVALLGANGAGKSTLLKLLATLTAPTEGGLSLFGASVRHDTARARSQIGLIGHQSMLYRDLTARENLEFFARLYAVPNPKDRATTLLDAMGLVDRANDAVKTFSRGMTQRLAIARALVHRPKLLLADEPFDGLDAPSSRELENLLLQLHEAGRTIILANHDLPQSLRLTSHAIVLRGGRIMVNQPTATLSIDRVLSEMERP
jgi:heme exporter protein A